MFSSFQAAKSRPYKHRRLNSSHNDRQYTLDIVLSPEPLEPYIRRSVFVSANRAHTLTQSTTADPVWWLVGWLEFNVHFQHNYGYIREEIDPVIVALK